MKSVVEIDGKRLLLSNLNKVLYPAASFTKGDMLEYYGRIARFIIPHLQGRALTMKRYPEGVDHPFFFEKRCPIHPPWVQTAEIEGKGEEGLTACLVNDPGTLIWVANLASLELHTPLSRAATPATPDAMVFDLDPGEPADILSCARVALILRELLSKMKLESFVKTSGMKGLHIYVPLNLAGTTFEATKEFSKAVALVLQKNYPDLITAKMAREERCGRVFINWSQNDASKTMACAYSLRAREEPLVSFPVAWKELENLAARGEREKLRFTTANVVARTEKDGDLFKKVLVMEQRLPHL